MKKTKILSILSALFVTAGITLASCEENISSNTDNNSNTQDSSTTDGNSSTTHEEFKVLEKLTITNSDVLNKGWSIGEKTRNINLEVEGDFELTEIVDKITISSSDESVATVEGLVLTPLKVGTTKLVANYTDKHNNVNSAEVVVEIRNMPSMDQFDIDAQASYANYYETHKETENVGAVYTNGSNYRLFNGEINSDTGDFVYFDLGGYDLENDMFSNTNRFVIDYDNSGLPVVVDLNKDIEGIENMALKDVKALNDISSVDSIYNHEVYKEVVWEDFRQTTKDKIKAYNVIMKLGETSLPVEGEFEYNPIEFGNVEAYNPMFDFSTTSSYAKVSFKSSFNNVVSENDAENNKVYKVSNQKYRYQKELADKIEDSAGIIYSTDEEGNTTNLIAKDLNYDISFGDSFEIPEEFNNLPVTEDGKHSKFVDLGTSLNTPKYTVAHNIDIKNVKLHKSYSKFGDYILNKVSDVFSNTLTIDLTEYEEIGSYAETDIPATKDVAFENLTKVILDNNISSIYKNTIKHYPLGASSFIEKVEGVDKYSGIQLVINNQITEETPIADIFNNTNVSTFDIYETYFNKYMSSDNKTFNWDFDIPANKILNVPYMKGQTKIGNLNKDESADTTYGDDVLNVFENPSDPNRQLTISLADDVTLSGTLALGATWSDKSLPTQGHITKEYNAIDLNGHTLTIADGGVLNSYGFIYDSVGTGKIDVLDGGTVFTNMVVTTFSGGQRTANSANSGIFSFEDYSMPYLNCDVKFNYGSNMKVHATLFASVLQPALDVEIIGDKGLFKLEKGSSLTMYNSYKVDEQTKKVNENTFEQHFDIVGDCAVNKIVLSAFMIVNIDSTTMLLNIPQFFNISHKDGTIRISNALRFMQGSTFTTSETSKIVFTNNLTGENKMSVQSGILLDSGITPTISSFQYNAKMINSIDIEQLHFADGVADFTREYKINRPEDMVTGISLDGIISFEGKNHFIGGNINLSETAHKSILDNIEEIALSEVSFFKPGTYRGVGAKYVGGRENNTSGKVGPAYYENKVLTSNGKSYIKLDNQVVEVEYDVENGIAKANDKNYMFMLNNELYSFDLPYDVNASGKWVEVTVDDKTHTVSYQNKRYIYFLGTLIEVEQIKLEGTKYVAEVNNKHFLYNYLVPTVMHDDITLEWTDQAWKQVLPK